MQVQQTSLIGVPVVQEGAKRDWNILISDVDVGLHVRTRLEMKDVVIHGRKLNFLHAFSRKETIERLRESADIDLIFLDVDYDPYDTGLRNNRLLSECAGGSAIPVVLLSSAKERVSLTEDVPFDTTVRATIDKQHASYKTFVDTLTALLPEN